MGCAWRNFAAINLTTICHEVISTGHIRVFIIPSYTRWIPGGGVSGNRSCSGPRTKWRENPREGVSVARQRARTPGRIPGLRVGEKVYGCTENNEKYYP
ncbi:hypothetical protein FKM82_019993 [Ascaphus truei]